MTQELKVALFGIGGYAANYLEALKKPKREKVRLIGAVDPFAQDFSACPLYPDAESLFREQHPDIAVIATPIQFHAEQAIAAFAHGCHVVLEKPLAATVESALALLEARDRAGKLLNVDYQWCYDPVFRAAKADADAGVFGAPVSLRAIVLWPRGLKYYRRGSGWAGKKKDAEGRPVYDSVLNNATAHYLMNMLFMTGAGAEQVRCATFRANPIETYDTAVMTARSAGVEVFIAVSHAVGMDCEQDPLLEYRYEKATLRFGLPGGTGNRLTAQLDSGEIRDYGQVGEPYMENLWNMTDAIRDGREILCPGETALRQTRALQEMRLLQPDARPFPEKWVRRDGEMNWVPGLDRALWSCYDRRALPVWDWEADTLRQGNSRFPCSGRPLPVPPGCGRCGR